MNGFVLIGTLSDEPVLKRDFNNNNCCINTLIVKGNSNTLYINFIIKNSLAEYLCRYATKGSRIAMHGKLDQNKKFDYSKNTNEYELIIKPNNIEIIDYKNKKEV